MLHHKRRKSAPKAQRSDRVIGNCWCGQPAVTNSSAGTYACETCLKREQSFANAEIVRSAIETKLQGEGKYLSNIYRLAPR